MILTEGFLTRAEERVVAAETVGVRSDGFMAVKHIVDGIASLDVDLSGIGIDNIDLVSVFVIRIIPYSDSDIVNSTIFQKAKYCLSVNLFPSKS